MVATDQVPLRSPSRFSRSVLRSWTGIGLLAVSLLTSTLSFSASSATTGPAVGADAPTLERAGAVCVAGGPCAIGDTGPGGGIVFYDAGSLQPWGRYLEAAPAGWSGSQTDPQVMWCQTSTEISGAAGTAIGTGATNTAAMLAACSSGAATVVAQGTAVTPSPESSGSEVLVPSAPRAIRVTAGTRSAIIAWKAPAEPGASAVLRYRVTAIPFRVSVPGGRFCSTKTTSCRVTGLRAGESYRFMVVARNKSGRGAQATSTTVPIPQSRAVPQTRAAEPKFVDPKFMDPKFMDPSSTAQMLAIYAGGGKTDWFVPSKDELDALFQQRVTVGGTWSGYWWSSSQVDANNAWTQTSAHGGLFAVPSPKSGLAGVRPVRAF